MTRRLTVVLDDSVTETECRDCEFGESRGIVRGRDVFSCALFDHKDVTDSRLTECLEAERAAARDAQSVHLGAAVRGVLEDFGWDHAAVRSEVEDDRHAETVVGCLLLAIERVMRPADFGRKEGR